MLYREEIVLNRLNHKGFSLPEVIVTIVLVAIVGAMLFSFMGKKITKSGRAVNWMADEFELSKVMESILADYRKELGNETLDLATFMGERDTASEINDKYDSNIDSANAERTGFQPDPSPSVDYTESGTDNTIWKVTLTKGDQELITIFTE